jgi:hypothetical protein
MAQQTGAGQPERTVPRHLAALGGLRPRLVAAREEPKRSTLPDLCSLLPELYKQATGQRLSGMGSQCKRANHAGRAWRAYRARMSSDAEGMQRTASKPVSGRRRRISLVKEASVDPTDRNARAATSSSGRIGCRVASWLQEGAGGVGCVRLHRGQSRGGRGGRRAPRRRLGGQKPWLAQGCHWPTAA